MTATPTALYLRQSLDATGEGLAVQRQREDALELATRRGLNVVAEHVDNDISASGKKRRPGFEALLADVEAGHVKAVIAWSLDRLTRNARDRLRLLEAGREAGLVLALVRGSDLDLSTPSGRMVADVLGSVAQHEIDVKSDRQRRAALQRAETGRPPLGVRLTGYTAAGEVVEHEAKTIRWIFDEFMAGDSLRSITTRLNETGTPTRHGGRWNPSTTRGILINARYAGRAVYMGEENGKTGGWPALVDGDQFDAVAARLADPRRRTQVGTDRKHLGSGLYECAICGGKVSGWSQNRYRCKEAHVNRSHGPVDRFVIEMIRDRLARPDLALLLPAEESGEAKRIGDEIGRLRARLARIEADYDAELIDGRRYKVSTEKVRVELTSALAAQGRLSGASGAASVLGAADPVAAFDAAPLMIRRAVLETLCVVRLSSAPRGSHTFDPMSVGDSRWMGDSKTWGELWRAMA